MKDKVLILGANGFLGRHVTIWLSARGYRLRLFDLNFRRKVALPGYSEVETVEGNFMNPSDVERALDGVDIVLHFISTTVPASSINDVTVEIETNITASVKLFELMVEKNVRFIGLPSSGGTVYGDSGLDHHEEESLRPSCPYGLGKTLLEEIVRFYSEYRSINYQIWRISNPYGDTTKVHRVQGVIDAFLQKVENGEHLSLWGDGSAVRDFIFIDDVVAAIGAMLEQGVKNEVVNIGSGRGHSIREVLEVIRVVVGREFSVDLTDGYAGVRRAVLDIDKIKRLTGWQPSHSLEEGITETWRRLTSGAGGLGKRGFTGKNQ
jgi:UDP-glucose 4-epimerase